MFVIRRNKNFFTARSRAETINYAENVLLRLNDPFFFDSTAMQVTPSIGIARYPEDGRTTSLLLIRADEAMYTVKQEERTPTALNERQNAPSK